MKDPQPGRGSRLIVRNLPFDFTEQDLRAIFLPYGPIHSINMPVANTTEDAEKDKQASTSRSKGFAFVWMLSKKDAEGALKECNGMKVRAGMANAIVSDKQKRKKDRREEKKRTQSVNEEDSEEGIPERSSSTSRERMMVVDWALSKDRWEEAKSKLEEVGERDGQEDVDMKSSDLESEGSDDESQDNSDEVSEDGHLGIHEDSEGDDDDDDDDDDQTFAQNDDVQEAVKPKLPETDVGTTLFVRNIPFTATEDEIRTLWALRLAWRFRN